MNVKEILTGARDIVASGWCQGSMGIDAAGRRAESDDDVRSATQVCSMGAIYRVTATSYEREKAAAALIEQIDGGNSIWGWAQSAVASWNDRTSTTHEDVLSIFNKAIEVASDAELVEPEQQAWPQISFYSSFTTTETIYLSSTQAINWFTYSTQKAPSERGSKPERKTAKGAPAVREAFDAYMTPINSAVLPQKLTGKPDWKKFCEPGRPPTPLGLVAMLEAA